MPPLLQTSKQLRIEGLPIFLAHNHFVATGGFEPNSFLIHWLGAIGKPNLRYLSRLTIDCTNHHGFTRDSPCLYVGDFSSWHELVACLTAFGLKPHQIRWSTALLNANSGFNQQLYHTYFFLKYTIMPLLLDHGILGDDPASSMISQLKDRETSAHSDPRTKTGVRRMLMRIEDSEKRIQSPSSGMPVPLREYNWYVSQIFGLGEGRRRHFSNLRFLHKQSEWKNYKETVECQIELQEQVEYHREHYLGLLEQRIGQQSSKTVFKTSKELVSTPTKSSCIGDGSEVSGSHESMNMRNYNVFLSTRPAKAYVTNAAISTPTAEQYWKKLPLDNASIPASISRSLAQTRNKHSFSLDRPSLTYNVAAFAVTPQAGESNKGTNHRADALEVTSRCAALQPTVNYGTSFIKDFNTGLHDPTTSTRLSLSSAKTNYLSISAATAITAQSGYHHHVTSSNLHPHDEEWEDIFEDDESCPSAPTTHTTEHDCTTALQAAMQGPTGPPVKPHLPPQHAAGNDVPPTSESTKSSVTTQQAPFLAPAEGHSMEQSRTSPPPLALESNVTAEAREPRRQWEFIIDDSGRTVLRRNMSCTKPRYTLED